MPISISTTKATYRAGSTWVPPETVPPVITAAGHTGTVAFSDGGAGGSFETLAANQARYIPANRTQVVSITGTDNVGQSPPITVNVKATFPLNGTWGAEGELDRETSQQKARGGERYSREEASTEFGQQIDCLTRSSDEDAALIAFWRFHRKIFPFIYLDLDTGESQEVFFTTGVKWRKDGGDSRSLYVNVRGYDNEVRYDLEPPVALLVTPANNATVSGASVLISATVTDNIEVQDVQFKVDGEEVDDLLDTPPYQINWDSRTVENGKRVITARARDTSGNQTEAPAHIVTVNN